MTPGLFTRLVRNTEEPATDTGCWLWNGRIVAHYGRINVRLNGRHRQLRAHRAMLVIMECLENDEPELFEELYDTYSAARMEAGHHCRMHPHCINPDHLQWLTQEEHKVKTKEQRRCNLF